MGFMRKRRTVAWLLAVVVGMMLVPAMSASAASQHETKQNAAIGKASKAATKALNRIAALTVVVTKHTQALTDLDTRVKAIEAGVPQVLDGLTKLSAAATQLKDGLTTVGAGLTTVGAGLTKLADAYGAVEYGVVRIYNTTDPNNITAIAPAVTTSDIPDDSNTAGASGSIPFVATAATKLHVTGAIRSAEADGVAGGDPAGQAGGIIYAVCATPPTSGGNCGGVAAGQIGCQAGPPPSSVFQTPAGPTNLLAVNIPLKSSRTGQTDPTPTGVDIIGGDCNIPTAGVWLVTLNAQFLDLPTSATPGPKD
jgi:hypothetical protein